MIFAEVEVVFNDVEVILNEVAVIERFVGTVTGEDVKVVLKGGRGTVGV
jgi:hypothetical protein